MIPEAQFCGGGETSLQGIFFNPNIPTEECFISPEARRRRGHCLFKQAAELSGPAHRPVLDSLPRGQRPPQWGAEENEALLTKLITMDEGSAYLGECALVPFNSPINETGILFYNTLFDENACCHLALGMGFADTIRDFEHKTLDECRALGVNDSMIHEDFMIGTADLSIDAPLRRRPDRSPLPATAPGPSDPPVPCAAQRLPLIASRGCPALCAD